MDLSSKQKKQLKGLAHNLNPVVLVGSDGVSAGVLKEINRCLENHELIKIKIRCDNQVELKGYLDDILDSTDASLVQVIGHSVILFKQSPELRIQLVK
ncbi:MAG: ribosome assembly RNA-binding protein YhbY [Pseudobacteriovorax sp.]|nr:ribosome assembly RNA-binding protein YhbY [Pseudobacteriovorax sp.]